MTERTEPEAPAASALPAGVAIRGAAPSDARSYREFWSAVVAEGRYVRSDRVTRSVLDYRRLFRRSRTPDRAEILALRASRVIGHVSVAREESPVTRHVASLGMAVAADWRGRGIASALMAEAFAWARWAGVEKIALSVYPDNPAARPLYAKFGFEEEGRLTGHSKKAVGYRDEIVMGVWLIPRPAGGGEEHGRAG